MTAISEREQQAYIAGQAADARVKVELDTGDMLLNIGPQHPATHGTLRIACELDGELVILASPSWVTCTVATRSCARCAPTHR